MQVLLAIPDETNLILLIEERGSAFLPSQTNTGSVQRALSTLQTIRWALFALLFVLGGALAWVSWTSFSRAAIALGTSLVLAAGLYFVATYIAVEQVDELVRGAFEERARALGQSDSVVRVASEGAMQTARESARSALGTKGLPVTVSLLIGFGLLAAGAATRKR